METFYQNMAEFLLVIGLLLLVIEVLVLGFSTFFLFFLGVGCIATGLIFFSGLLVENTTSALMSVAIISSLSSLLLWKPLKRMQNKVDTKAVTSDFIGHRFSLDQDLAQSGTVNHQYSGINWKISCDVPLKQGTQVEVIAVGVGKMTVRQV
ncbi:MAG: NfeD family protein [Oceanospirillaceae bacterium]|nr:NfeD family protein [Oceanospirillaceae bacterium]